RRQLRSAASVARADLQGDCPMNPQSLSTARAAYLVGEREVVTRVRSKAFIISTVIPVLGIVAGIIIMNIVAGQQSTTTVAAAEPVASELTEFDGLEVIRTESAESARELVIDDRADAAVIADSDSATGVT